LDYEFADERFPERRGLLVRNDRRLTIKVVTRLRTHHAESDPGRTQAFVPDVGDVEIGFENTEVVDRSARGLS